jgi:KDO2-lipid IV(A) lauroyltransferase
MKRLRQFCEAAAFRGLVFGISILPPWLAARCARGLAWFVFRCLPRKLTRYPVAAENIRASFPGISDAEVDALILGMWRHLFQMVMEIIQLPRRWKLIDVLDLVEFRNKPQVVKALLGDRPVLVLAGHYGNWEMAVSTFGQFGFRMGVVARDLDNPALHKWFESFRRFTGHYTISKNGGSQQMMDELARKGRLALLCDQDAGPNGVFVDFFGRPASTFKSIALLAIEYDALIVVGYARRLNEVLRDGWPRYEVGCEAIFDPRDYPDADAVKAITQAYTTALEAAVRLSPEQYFWIHRRWKSEPRVRKKKASAADPALESSL